MKEILNQITVLIETLASSVDSLELALIARGYVEQGEANVFLTTALQNSQIHTSNLRSLIAALPENKS